MSKGKGQHWYRLVLGHGWRGQSILASFLVVSPIQAKGTFGCYREWLSNQQQSLGTSYKCKFSGSSLDLLSQTQGVGWGHQSVLGNARGLDVWEDLRTTPVAPAV